MTERSPRAAAALLLALSLAALASLCVALRIPMADALVYRAEGAAVASGSSLYGFTVTAWQLPATYPPFAALLFVPTAYLPPDVLRIAFGATNSLLAGVLVVLSCRFAGIRPRGAYVLGATALALWLEPVFQTLLFGQVNLALTCLVLWDLSRPAGAFGKGLGVGIAAGIKITPLFFVLHLLVRGQRREAAVALAGFGASVLLGAAVLPGASVEFFTRRLFETGRVGKAWIVDNQSLQGLLARLLHTPAPGVVWAAAAGAVGAAGLWAARRTGERWALLVSAFTALLVSPISWSHHWVWCVPLIALTAAEGRTRTAVLLAAVFTARTLWLVPHAGDLDLRLPLWQQPLASPYPLAGLAVVAWAGVSAGRSRAERPGADAQLPARSSSASMIR
ncbi:glycosyltransferase 87 family protein [Streptomyces sp. NBC_00083]|uniref:glycosyltransferase 87 family protein n=1 Tax=Streptomyces sp. NBC_00083 TaxID=2975647 RepID=UPI0022531928|nr:glycosyltransferase 87 family protein [Streptomyces sp. NBC_00083]MCX5387906.1 glycosyltransferase 87 family protein [Streptomyces sp. NBC_00083]